MINKNAKLLIGAGVICAVLVLAGVALVSQAAPNEHSQKPNIHKPVPAVDVELVKKVTIKEPKGKGKPAQDAATGELGTLVTGDKYAIIIGINDYPGTANDLQYTVNDANEMYEALTTNYGYDPANIHLLTDLQASSTAILNAVNDIKGKALAGDEVVFFFSGHGGKGRAADGDKEAIDESIISHNGNPDGSLIYIWDGELKQWFSDFKTSRIIFVFDSCLAGGMTDLAAPGRIINMATTETGTAYEFDSLQNGQFTYYFIEKGMLQGSADTTGTSGVVTVEEAFDYAKLNCSFQTPTIKDSFTNDLFL